MSSTVALIFFFFQAEDGIRDYKVTGVQTCALPIYVLGGSETASYLRLTIRGQPSARVQACILAVAGVVSVSQEETHGEVTAYLVQVQYLHVAESLVAALVAHGFGVLEIAAARLDLETLFLQLTRPE